MDDMASKLSELLSDPDAVDKIRNMAGALLGGEESKPLVDMPSDIPADIDIGAIMKIVGALNSGGNDNRSQLLLALKPHLSEPRRERVDSAIKILKLINILPLIKDQGLLKL
ncbi:MAG: hypothetical protein PHV07_05650 [Oscillospiraceae bacterium]|nr:hypothetical protein [Oscillospiraceae bacterium]